jgi:hypothetical protein
MEAVVRSSSGFIRDPPCSVIKAICYNLFIIYKNIQYNITKALLNDLKRVVHTDLGAALFSGVLRLILVRMGTGVLQGRW